MNVRALAGAGLLLLGLAGCGAPAGDLFLVQRGGSVPGARLTLVVDDGGFVRCNKGDRRQISSAQLISAREIARDLDGEDTKPGPTRRNLTLPPLPGSILRYSVRTEAGSAAFSDTSAAQPKVLYRIAALTRELAKQVCGLPR